jgi:hypothetical protein
VAATISIPRGTGGISPVIPTPALIWGRKPRADNELMLAKQYAEAVRGAARPVSVKLIEGVNHMRIVSDPAAVSIGAD